MSLQSFEFFSLGVYFNAQILHTKLYRNVCFVLGFTKILDVSSGDMIWKSYITPQGLQQKQNLKIWHNVEKWSNILQKSYSVHTAGFLQHVFLFFQISLRRMKTNFMQMLKLIIKVNIRHIYKYLQLLLCMLSQI